MDDYNDMLNHSEIVLSGSDELQAIDDTRLDGMSNSNRFLSFCKTHKLSYL